MLKTCNGCKNELSLVRFGLKQTRCKFCQLIYAREYRKKNPKKYLLASKKWRKKKQIENLRKKLDKLISEMNANS